MRLRIGIAGSALISALFVSSNSRKQSLLLFLRNGITTIAFNY